MAAALAPGVVTQSSDVYGLYQQPMEPFFAVTTAPGYTLSSITYNGEELLSATWPWSEALLYACEENLCILNINWDRIRQNETLTVRFTRPYDYQLSFDANGGFLRDGETFTQIVGTGATITYPANPFGRSGYRFLGWTSTGDTDTIYTAGTVETLTSDITWTLYANWDPITSGTAVVFSPGIGAGETSTIYLETPDFVLPELPSASPVGDLYPVWWDRNDQYRYFAGDTAWLVSDGSNYYPETLTVSYQPKIPLTLILANPESGTLTFDGVTLDSNNPRHTFMMLPGAPLRIEPSPNNGYIVESFTDEYGSFGMPWPFHERSRYLGATGNQDPETITITFGPPISQVTYFTEDESSIELPVDENLYRPGDVITLATLADFGLNETNSALYSDRTAITSWRVIDGDTWTNRAFGETLTAGLYGIGVTPVFTEIMPIVVVAGYGESSADISDLSVTFNEQVFTQETFADGDNLLRGYTPKFSESLTVTMTARTGREIYQYRVLDGNYQELETGTVFADSFTVNIGGYRDYLTFEVSLVDPTFNYQITVMDSNNQIDLDRSMSGRWSDFLAPGSYLHLVDQTMVIEWQDGDGNTYLPGYLYPITSEGFELTLFPVFTPYVTVDLPDPGTFNGYAYTDYLVGMFDYTNQILTLPIGETFTYGIHANEGYQLTGFSVNDISYIDNLIDAGEYSVLNYGPVMENVTIAVNVDLERTQFDVNFNFNGGSDGPTDYSGYGDSIELPMEIPVLAGYTFMGWRDVDFSDAIYQAGDIVDIAASFPAISLYFDAIWTRSTYNYAINFDPGYGTGTGITLSGTGSQFVYDEEATNEVMQPGNIDRTGWKVTGWNTRADMSGNSYDVAFTLDLYTESYTLFAEWTKCYNGDCTLDANRPPYGGISFSVDYRVDYNETTTVSASYRDSDLHMPTMQELLGSGYNRTGAQFIGWNSEVDGEGTWFLPGDRYDIWMGDETLGQNGWDVSMIPADLYAFYSTSCSIPENCTDILVPIRFSFDSHINAVTANSEHSAEYFPWGRTASFEVNYQTGYCLNTVMRNGQTFIGDLETLTADRAMTIALTSSRCTFDLSLYIHDSASVGSLEISNEGVLSDYVIDFPNPLRSDYTFLGWATTPNGSPTYQRGSSIMLLSATLDLYAIWRYNFVSVTVNLIADNEDEVLPYIGDYIGVNGDRITGPLWLQRGPNGTVAETITIGSLGVMGPYIIDSITALGEVLDCTSIECPETEIEFTALDTDTVINVYAHHRVFNYTITYIGIDTSTTISGSGASVRLADATLFGMQPSIQNGDSDSFVSGWVSSNSILDPTGLRFALEGDLIETYTAVWDLGYQVDLSVANGVGGNIRWVYPADLSNYPEPIFSTRTSQSTFWYQDQLPHLPFFKVEPDQGYELYSIKYRGGEVIDSVFDATYRGGVLNQSAYLCDSMDPTECYFTLAEISDRVRIGDLIFEFRPKYSYTFAFEAGGGVLINGETDTARIGSATRFMLPDALYTKAGHDFMGWMDSDGLVSRAGNNIDITSDISDTFTAVWQIQSYVVNFAGADNARVESTSSHQGAYEYDSSDTFEVTPNDGFCVGGNIDVDGESMINMSSYDASRTFSLVGIRSDLTLTFDIHNCAYQYLFNQENNDGSNTGIPVSGGTDRYLTMGVPTSIPSGARFLYWATNADGSGDTYTSGALIDLTTESFTASAIYAQWAISPEAEDKWMYATATTTPSPSTTLSSFITSFSCQYLEYYNDDWHEMSILDYGTGFSEIRQYWFLSSNNRIVCSNFSFIPGTRMEDGYTPSEGTMVVRWPSYSLTFNTLADGISVNSISGNNYLRICRHRARELATHSWDGT